MARMKDPTRLAHTTCKHQHMPAQAPGRQAASFNGDAGPYAEPQLPQCSTAGPPLSGMPWVPAVHHVHHAVPAAAHLFVETVHDEAQLPILEHARALLVLPARPTPMAPL